GAAAAVGVGVELVAQVAVAAGVAARDVDLGPARRGFHVVPVPREGGAQLGPAVGGDRVPVDGAVAVVAVAEGEDAAAVIGAAVEVDLGRQVGQGQEGVIRGVV